MKNKKSLLLLLIVAIIIGLAFIMYCSKLNRIDKLNTNKIIKLLDKKYVDENVNDDIKIQSTDKILNDFNKPYIKNIYVTFKGLDYNKALENIEEEWIYTIKDSKDVLYLYIKNDKVINYKKSGYEFLNNSKYMYKDTEYKISYYNYQKVFNYMDINVDELNNKYKSKMINEFNSDYSRENANIVAVNEKGDKVYYYPMRYEGNNQSDECYCALYIYTINDKIISIKIDEANFIYDKLEEHFKDYIKK